MIAAPTGARAKALGAFYTDSVVARFLAQWAIRSEDDTLIDPSFGGGVFLRSAAEVLRSLGGRPFARIYGVEIDPEVHKTVVQSLAIEGLLDLDKLKLADFFDVSPSQMPPFDCVLGNPPFIRYQAFNGEVRNRALARAKQAGVSLSKQSSSWAPFVIHACTMLKTHGRLAMVVPEELGRVSYARPVLDYLCRKFKSVTIVLFREKLFPQLSQDVALLLADGMGLPPTKVEILELDGIEDLEKPWFSLKTHSIEVRPQEFMAGTRKLTASLIPSRALNLYEELNCSTGVAQLGQLADVGIGYVTGANSFFHLSKRDMARWSLPESAVVRSVFRSGALRGLRFTDIDWLSAERHKSAGYLLCVDDSTAALDSVAKYLDTGVRNGVNESYKCRSRSPWYKVPGVVVPDGFLTYMGSETTAIVENSARVSASNTLHVLRLKSPDDQLVRRIAMSWISSLTELSVELEGHALGGGLLKLEPREALRVSIALPKEKFLETADEVDNLVRQGRRKEAREVVNSSVLIKGLGLSTSDVTILSDAAQQLRERRLGRKRR